ncbi:hypothetical protein Asppvi_008266 [Aspergillus pseudoviridinutans]|uniref:Uncharacterized protein n=1 Tax=Aspergillus pseudoviridinutans TaxID=1517512 RepID=A0A9P3BJ81_9EURO|nr:uncharacterized protein Asppvi_008266 [Aspergillus pseudoviridinutans]GIJ89328.1 hypothetical protein Asppvi_008266 [Aspergillus pseudoviridinutans]
MTSKESCIPTTQETIWGLYKVAKSLNPDNKFSVHSFKGSDFDNVATESDLTNVILSMTFNTGANIAQRLKDKILDPLSKAAVEKKLNPTVMLSSSIPKFSAQVTKFKSQLDSANATGPTILFCLCHVGNNQSAAGSLKELNTDPAIKNLILYSKDPINTKLQSIGGDSNAYVRVIISDLIKALDL